MIPDNEIVIKHLLGKIVYKTRTQNTDNDVQIDKKITILDLAPNIIEQKGFKKEYLNKTLSLTLQDVFISEEDDAIFLMINCNPANSKSTVIKNTVKNTREEFTPDIKAGDRYEHSTHVVIKYLPRADGEHDVLLEKTEHMTTQIFSLFINKVLFEIAKKHESDFTSKAKYSKDKVRFKPVLEIHSKPDEEFLKHIKIGNISDIVFIKSTPQVLSIPNENIKVVTKEHSLKIDVKSISSDALGFLKKAGRYLSSPKSEVSYDKIRVTYKSRESNSGKGNSVAYFDASSMTQDAKETVVTQKYIISNFKAQMKSAYEKINDEIIQKILECVKD